MTSKERTRKIYALLVGIDDYPMPVSPLRGCKRDICRIKSFIEKEFDETSFSVLTDSDATKANIISEMRGFLAQAGKEDVALLYYAGHGSRQRTAPEFKEFFRNGFEETLVCFDSRLAGGQDLADKELAILFEELGRNDPHIVAIFDCCHSGGITRKPTMVPRSLEARLTNQELGEYLDGYFIQRPGKEVHIPETKMLKIAASSSIQSAHESSEFGGLFTYHFIGVLEATGIEISYATLFRRIRKQMTLHNIDQRPELEAHLGFEVFSKLFSGQPMESQRFSEIYFENKEWWIEAGAIDGLPTSNAIYLRVIQDKKEVGVCYIDGVGLEKSILNSKGLFLDESKVYQSQLVNYDPAPIPISFEGSLEARKELEMSVNIDELSNIELVDSHKMSDFGIKYLNQDFFLYHNASGMLIQGAGHDPEEPESANLKSTAFSISRTLSKVLKWNRACSLKNDSRNLDPKNFDFRLIEFSENGDQTVHEDEFNDFLVGLPPEYPKKVKLKLQVRNRSMVPYYFTMFNFSREYGIMLIRSGRIYPDSEYTTFFGESPGHKFVLPEQYDENTDICRLIVSAGPLDDFHIVQKPIKIGEMSYLSRHPIGIRDRSNLVKNWCVITKHIRLRRVGGT